MWTFRFHRQIHIIYSYTHVYTQEYIHIAVKHTHTHLDRERHRDRETERGSACLGPLWRQLHKTCLCFAFFHIEKDIVHNLHAQWRLAQNCVFIYHWNHLLCSSSSIWSAFLLALPEILVSDYYTPWIVLKPSLPHILLSYMSIFEY